MTDTPAITVHGPGAGGEEPLSPCFYVDLASPECYLSAEQILALMPVPVEWVPVHLQPPAPDDAAREAIAAAARSRDLQTLRWPPAFDAELANLAATYAKSIGRSVAFLLAALRQAYAGGRDLSLPDHVIIAASACEMHPNAVLRAVATRGTRRTLETATATARERGVTRTPAVWLPPAGGGSEKGTVLHGDAQLPEAAARLA